MSNVENTILKVMDTHPKVAAAMPVFEDKRKVKIVNFAGYDVFQTHIMNASAYLKQHMNELNFSKLGSEQPPLYSPPSTLRTAADKWRMTPAVKELQLPSFKVSKVDVLGIGTPAFQLFAKQMELECLFAMPLAIIGLGKFIQATKSSENTSISEVSPLTVMEHPSSRSHIARTAVDRLEKDIKAFAHDENSKQRLNYSPIVQCNFQDKSSILSAFNATSELINTLSLLRERDSMFTRKSISQLIKVCNGRAPGQETVVSAVGHVAKQLANTEASLVRYSLHAYYYDY